MLCVLRALEQLSALLSSVIDVALLKVFEKFSMMCGRVGGIIWVSK